jgi:hypothetical protein
MIHLVVNVEHWEFDAPMPRTIITPPHGKENRARCAEFQRLIHGMRCGLQRIIAGSLHAV